MSHKKQKHNLGYFWTVLLTAVLLGLSLLSSPMASAAKENPNYTPPPVACNESVLNQDNCRIVFYLVVIINVLSALVGLTIVAVIIVAGIQFSTAGNDPQKIAAAKGRIVNALLALAVFIFMYAFLQWVVPGGIF